MIDNVWKTYNYSICNFFSCLYTCMNVFVNILRAYFINTYLTLVTNNIPCSECFYMPVLNLGIFKKVYSNNYHLNHQLKFT